MISTEKETKRGEMKLFFFTFFLVGASFARPNNDLLNLQKSTILSSVKGMVKSVPTLLDDPKSKCERKTYHF